MLREIANDLWVTDRSLRFGGFGGFGGMEIGTRMTVVRLADGSLFLHSPVGLDDALRAELEARGTPRHVVAPNKMHHLFAGEYPAAWPEAKLYGAPGLDEKRKDLRFDAILGDEPEPAWKGEIDQALVNGIPIMNEVVFRHAASRTLLVTDLAFNVGPDSHWMTKLGFRMLGAYGRFGPTVMEKLFARDRAAMRASLERILEWDFDRVVVTHGQVLESGGREGLRQGYRWLLQG